MTSATLERYGHVNNSLWVFRADESNGGVHFKVLPSRRSLPGSDVRNVSSLETGWIAISGPRLSNDKPATATIGAGVGSVSINVATRDVAGNILVSGHLLNTVPVTGWNGSWTQPGFVADEPVDLAPAGSARLALAWRNRSDGSLRIQFRESPGAPWGVVVSGERIEGSPKLLWDGTALNVFYRRQSDSALRHALVTPIPIPTIEPPRTVLGQNAIDDDAFDVIAYNDRLHVVARSSAATDRPLVYTTSLLPFGSAKTWAPPSEIIMETRGTPKLAYVNDNLFVLARAIDGRLHSARLDPNHPVNATSGVAGTDRWLEVGAPVGRARRYQDLDVVSFNSDIYLVATRAPADDVGTTDTVEMVNFSRFYTKRFLTEDHGIRLMWGGLRGGNPAVTNGDFAQFQRGDSAHPFLPEEGEVPLVGDFDGDGRDDLIRFPQRPVTDVSGPAPVLVSIAESTGVFREAEVWHMFFSLQDEIPLVGDFNGDGLDDIATFVQSRQFAEDGSLLGLAPVWVALSDGQRFTRSRIWHPFFSLRGEIPMIGDFNGDGRDDIATFVQSQQFREDGSEIGPAPVWVALSSGSTFEDSKVWHTFFSLNGEVPMTGDFDGDGRDDIVSFVQKEQLREDGSVLGQAPVWVSLSTGTSFADSKVWHPFFSLAPETPRVGDINADGRDDIVTFLDDAPDDPRRKRNVLTAFSHGTGFERSVSWLSDFSDEGALPMIASTNGKVLGDLTGRPQDVDKPIPVAISFGPEGIVHIARSLENTPMPSGAPWESYKWFTEKGLGTMMFPSWIWEKDCLAPNHLFVLLGASGSGGATVTNHSVRLGGREGHVLQEVGHSIFANCFRPGNDAFGLSDAIFGTLAVDGQPGFDADTMLLCPGNGPVFPALLDFIDCRDPEHYFLGFLVKYRLEGDRFRSLVAATTSPDLAAYYAWLKDIWYEGTEFTEGAAASANFSESGVRLLP